MLKQVVCGYSIDIPTKAVLKFGNRHSYSFSLGSVPLPEGVANGQKVLLDLELVEVKGEGVQVRVDSVRALTQGDQKPVNALQKAPSVPDNPVAGTAAATTTNNTTAVSAAQGGPGTLVVKLANKALPSQPTEWEQNILSKPNYFLLISTTVEHLLGSVRAKLASLYRSLVAVVAPISYDADSELGSVSLDVFERCIRAESGLFLVCRKKVVSLQPAGLAFVERYLSLCPVLCVAREAIQSAFDANLPVSEVPPHAPGAYLRLRLWSLLRVRQKQWRAQFTFRADRQKVFYFRVSPPSGMVETVQLQDIATRIRPIQIEIGTGDNDGRALSLTYQFLPAAASPPPAQFVQLPPPIVPPPTHNLPMPDLLSHRSRGMVVFDIHFSLV